MTIQFDSLQVFLLVFVRMISMLGFNPLMQRRNVPRRIVTGLALCMTVLIAPTLPAMPELSGFAVAMAMLRELVTGIVCGMVFQIFYYLLFFVGDFMDMQFGLSMAKVFDPGTNMQTSISSNLLTILFVLYFFTTGSHLVMIKIFASSYMIIPAGAATMTFVFPQFMVELFTQVFSLVIRLLLPFAVAEFTVEVSMGVLMKLIPQIHVFVINMQVKIAMAMFLLILFAAPVAAFVDNYIVIMLENMQRAVHAMVA